MTLPAQRPNTVLMVIAAMFVGLVVIVFARLAYGMILPPMREDLGMTYGQAGMLGTVTALGYVCFVLVGGNAAARWGARLAVAFGLLMVTIGFTGLSLASAYPALVVLMALLGFGTAFSFAPMVSLLAGWYPEKRGVVIGFMSGGIGAGTLLIGLLLPWLYELFGNVGWRIAWGVFAAVGLAVSILVLAIVRDPPAADSATHEHPPAADKWRIYTHPRIITVGVVYGIVGLTYIVQAVFMVSFMVESGFNEATAGTLLAMSGLLSLASGVVWGSVSDRLGRGNALTVAMAMVTAAMLLVLVNQSFISFFLHFLIIGCSVNGVFTMIQASATDQVTPRYIPIAFSFVTLFFAGGQLFGPAIAGWLIDGPGGFRAAIAFTCTGLAIGMMLAQRIRRFPRAPAVGDPVSS